MLNSKSYIHQLIKSKVHFQQEETQMRHTQDQIF